MQASQWPLVYKVRVSQRARNVNLKFCRSNGLEVVVPKNFNIKKVPQILEKHRVWIERVQTKIENVQLPANPLPENIYLPALPQIWQIHYLPTAASVLYLKPTSENQLLISGCLNNVEEVKKLLCKWLKRLAANYLFPKLKQLSELYNLPYAKVSIRYSQTHWGSCSAKKNISLSPHLLFIEPVLVEHVLLHELCHTKVLNHSKNFWQLLKSVNPDCHDLRKQLREAQYKIPPWLLEKK
jgi:predicted metal-dependent hydrolase